MPRPADRALRFVAVKLEPYRRGIGGACRHELDQPHVVVAKSRERDGLGALKVWRSGGKLNVTSRQPQLSAITLTRRGWRTMGRNERHARRCA